ncbi:putative membrane protein [Flavobacterium sp. 7E]|uniref:vitamin K epoxide reductase family protein n=1 Tax=Flavobacterium sp. 7E TaxID=2735898 RepID=UPI00156DFC82|nr:vitamin K epoxide reductase family protein [Flavobacterium sp. 7E]NRS89750.1 putative membrane protein [Flavobacterium sp. 7E]
MISLVEKYLEISHYSSQKSEFEDLFQSHPNYPSLFAITDSLDLLSIMNMAVKVPKEQLVELPDFFLAIFNQGLVLVSKMGTEISIFTEKGEKQDLSFSEFVTSWSGVVIVIEPNEIILKESSKENINWLQYILPVLALIGVSLFYNSYTIYDFVFLLTAIAGLFFSVLIIQEKLGFSNEIVSKFCNISSNTSCYSVIRSDKGDINKWFSFSDLPLLFFSINLLSLLVQPSHSSAVAGFLSFLSLPIIAYSIWIQKMQLKKWCLLCLVTASIVVLQSVVWFFMAQTFLNISFFTPFAYLFCMIACTALWFALKPILENKVKAEKLVNELMKFKRNYVVFDFLLKDIPVLEGFDQLEGLRFGNRSSSLNLTLILSPSCGHCHTAFKDAFELVAKFPDKILLTVLFNVNPENNDNPYKVVVERLLTINNAEPDNIEEAISDWHIKKIGLDAWKDKWKVDSITMKVNHEIQKQYDWCEENKFNYTPIKFVNNKLFPDEYEIKELKYFLNDFEEKEVLLLINNLVERA